MYCFAYECIHMSSMDACATFLVVYTHPSIYHEEKPNIEIIKFEYKLLTHLFHSTHT